MIKMKNNKKSSFKLLIICLLLFSIAIVVSSATVSANSITINNTASGGIDYQLNNPNITVINLDSGIYSGLNNTNISINRDIEINGVGQGSTIIDGKLVNNIFIINSGCNVKITGITFKNSNDYAIKCENSNLTIGNCGFSNNGGGICQNGGSLTSIASSNFNDNCRSSNENILSNNLESNNVVQTTNVKTTKTEPNKKSVNSVSLANEEIPLSNTEIIYNKNNSKSFKTNSSKVKSNSAKKLDIGIYKIAKRNNYYYITIKNYGKAVTKKNYLATYTKKGNKYKILNKICISSLKVGKSKTFKVLINKKYKGMKTFKVDSTNQISEINEVNNIKRVK